MQPSEVIVAAETSPENPHNGVDIRLWNILGQGSSSIVCLRRKQVDDHGRPLIQRLHWAGVAEAGDMDRLIAYADSAKLSKFPILVFGRRLARKLTAHLPTYCYVDLVDSSILYHWRRAK